MYHVDPPPPPFLDLVCGFGRWCVNQVHRDHVAMAADGLGIDYTVHWDGILNRYTPPPPPPLAFYKAW